MAKYDLEQVENKLKTNGIPILFILPEEIVS